MEIGIPWLGEKTLEPSDSLMRLNTDMQHSHWLDSNSAACSKREREREREREKRGENERGIGLHCEFFKRDFALSRFTFYKARIRSRISFTRFLYTPLLARIFFLKRNIHGIFDGLWAWVAHAKEIEERKRKRERKK